MLETEKANHRKRKGSDGPTPTKQPPKLQPDGDKDSMDLGDSVVEQVEDPGVVLPEENGDTEPGPPLKPAGILQGLDVSSLQLQPKQTQDGSSPPSSRDGQV